MFTIVVKRSAQIHAGIPGLLKDSNSLVPDSQHKEMEREK